jgi:hypothetical protein
VAGHANHPSEILMRSGTSSNLLAAVICTALFMLPATDPRSLKADEGTAGGLGGLERHEHDPIVVHSRPVIERLPVQVVRPVDIAHSKDGNLLVADPGASVVFRVGTDGDVELLVESIADVSRVQCDRDNNAYILSGTTQSSTITQVTPEGKRAVVARTPGTAVTFARTAAGQIYAASRNGRIWRITADGQVTLLTQLAWHVEDLVLSSSEQLHVLTSDQKVLQLSGDGRIVGVRFATPNATRLFGLPAGQLAVLELKPGSRPAIVEVRDTEAESARPFAHVPAGTSAVAFDSLGNLCLANPELRAITKVTSRFSVPCPHCGRPVDMILSTERNRQSGTRRSF